LISSNSLYVRSSGLTAQAGRVPARVDDELARHDLLRLGGHTLDRRTLHDEPEPGLDLDGRGVLEHDVVRTPLGGHDREAALGEDQDERNGQPARPQDTARRPRDREVAARVEHHDVGIGRVDERRRLDGQDPDAVRQEPERREDLGRATGGGREQQQICHRRDLLGDEWCHGIAAPWASEPVQCAETHRSERAGMRESSPCRVPSSFPRPRRVV
jgi:hypothetical protein